MKWYFLAIIFLSSCVTDSGESTSNEVLILNTVEESEMNSDQLQKEIQRKMNSAHLVDIHAFDSRIQVDLKYSGTDNFMKRVLYDTLQRAYLQEEVAERLSICQDFLDSIKPGYRLLVYDAVRPVQVQQEMWNALDTIPISERGKFVSNPKLGSVHNYGAAVDITIVDENGKPLDMGAEYDDFREIAFPKLEAKFLASGELSRHQFANRVLLRKVMHFQKFTNIPSEWWHFNAYSRITASNKYQILLTESGKTKWWKVKAAIKFDSIIVIPEE